MPTYVYKCKENEHIFEMKQRFSDPPLAECPECGSDVRKLINSVGVVFKGSGFYVTDNRGKNSASPSTGSNGKEAGSGDKVGSENGEKPKSEKSAETPKPEKKKSAEPT